MVTTLAILTVKKLMSFFDKDSSKPFGTSVAPQCPFNDTNIGNVLNSPAVDCAIVKFYNNL